MGETHLSNDSKGGIPDTENVLVESSQSVLWRHSLERQKWVRKFVSRSENDLVDAGDACPVLEFYSTA